MDFLQRVKALPVLGIGVSTEYGAATAENALDIARLRTEHTSFASFLEIGVETNKGLDESATAWAQQDLPTTYHFLDINLDEAEDFDDPWFREVNRIQETIQPAWMCGDAGMWHFGPRERGHMLLLPPILSDSSASKMASGIQLLREKTGLEVFPENPPGSAYIGNLHLLEYFAKVCDEADTGILLDCAHLAIYQRMMGHAPLDGLDGFPLDRIVEMHVAGATLGEADGYPFVDDDHTCDVLPETWTLFEYLATRAENLKAVVFECERNPQEECLPGFERIGETLRDTPLGEALQAAGRPL